MQNSPLPDKIPLNDGGEEAGEDMNGTQPAGDTAKQQNPTPGKPVPPPAGQKDFPLYLSNNQRAILYVPATITAKDYALLKKQIENHLAVIEATSVADDDTKTN